MGSGGAVNSAAEAGLSLRANCGTAEAVPFPVNIKVKVKSSGQECPLHTGKGKQQVPHRAFSPIRNDIALVDGLISRWLSRRLKSACCCLPDGT